MLELKIKINEDNKNSNCKLCLYTKLVCDHSAETIVHSFTSRVLY